MATLKSIKNKYLTTSDGTVLGVTTNTENISLLSFKLATADSLSKFNLVDGFADDYQDATGVDAAASTNALRDSTGKYYEGQQAAITTDSFTTVATTTWTAPTSVVSPVAVFVVAGGGGGGHHYGGGGGAGGIVDVPSFAVTGGNGYTVTVGGGGAGTNGVPGVSGGDSVFGTLTAKGGGGGGGGNAGAIAGVAGGSGGGGAAGIGEGAGTQPSQPGASGSSGHGKPGGPGNSVPWGYSAGGGGGASANGAPSGGPSAGGAGGAGRASTIADGTTSVTYGGGGGGYTWNGTPASGGAGGGGAGKGNAGAAVAGTANTGGGGGGSAGSGGANYSQPGGSGIVMVRYNSFTGGLNMILQSNAYTAQTQPTTARIILDEWAYAGTQTLNTDIKAYASRDGGTTFTQATLVDQGYLLGAGGINGNTKLMLHMDGANAGTTFTDSSSEGGNTAHTVTAVGGAQTLTAQKKFGTASGYFDGTGDYLTLDVSADWNFGTGDFTIDGWIRTDTSPPTYGAIFDSRDTTSSATGFTFAVGSGGDIYIYSNGMQVQSSAGAITAETWHHVALVRASGTTKIYVDGASVGTPQAAARTYSNTTARIGIEAFGTSEAFKGYIDEFRITKGVAVWTANFTPPTQEYQTSRRLLSGSVDISGQPAGTNVKYKIETLNQAATKQTRVYGTSMAWA